MPVGHVEVVDGWPVRLHEWCGKARALHGQGRLPADLVAELETVPGWVWRKRQPAHDAVVTLPAGVEHGQPTGRTYFKCGCEPCRQASRRYQAQFKQRQVEQFTAGWVSAPAGARHVRLLLGTNPQLPRRAAAAAAGMTSTLLERVLDDAATPVPPWMADTLADLTLVDVMAWTRPTARGGLATRRDEPGDADAHAARLEAMWAADWTRAQLSCALGFSGNLGAVGRPNPPVASCHALTLLVQALGPDLTPPAWSRGRAACA